MSHTPQLTPCAGRCSTVFGDSVCRGCRRYSQEVIEWNTYDAAQQNMIWQRLDAQLDQVVLGEIAVLNPIQWQSYKKNSPLRLPKNASEGRWRYEALKTLLRQPHLIEHTGLNLAPHSLRPLWLNLERKLYSLGVAMYELTWLRAAQIQAQIHSTDDF